MTPFIADRASRVTEIEVHEVRGVMEEAQRLGLFQAAHPGEPFNPDYVAALWEQLVREGHGHVVVIRQAGELCGVLAWIASPGAYSPGGSIIVQFWTTSDRGRRCGAGQMFLDYIRWIGTERQMRVQVSCSDQTPIALVWALERSGFHSSTIDFEWRPEPRG